MTEPYIITTWTDVDGTDWAQWATSVMCGRAAPQKLARDMIERGYNPDAPVRIVGTNGGKLGSRPSLAELGRVKA
jgi:hypothetical protein